MGSWFLLNINQVLTYISITILNYYTCMYFIHTYLAYAKSSLVTCIWLRQHRFWLITQVLMLLFLPCSFVIMLKLPKHLPKAAKSSYWSVIIHIQRHTLLFLYLLCGFHLWSSQEWRLFLLSQFLRLPASLHIDPEWSPIQTDAEALEWQHEVKDTFR